MNANEALVCMKSGLEVEQLFRDPIGCREMLMLTDRDQIELFLPDFPGKGATDIMSPEMFLKSYAEAEFVLFERYHIT
jgi:hypothetical protein